MENLKMVLLICHIIVCIILTVIVLMQSGKAEGLSGSIAGGAETFFGKNKGRTIDAFLEKLTVVFAILFLVLSISLTVVTNKIAAKNAEAELQAALQNMQTTDTADVETQTTDDMASAGEEVATESDTEAPVAE